MNRLDLILVGDVTMKEQMTACVSNAVRQNIYLEILVYYVILRSTKVSKSLPSESSATFSDSLVEVKLSQLLSLHLLELGVCPTLEHTPSCVHSIPLRPNSV